MVILGSPYFASLLVIEDSRYSHKTDLTIDRHVPEANIYSFLAPTPTSYKWSIKTLPVTNNYDLLAILIRRAECITRMISTVVRWHKWMQRTLVVSQQNSSVFHLRLFKPSKLSYVTDDFPSTLKGREQTSAARWPTRTKMTSPCDSLTLIF